MLYNVPADRWHPIVFEERPLPGPITHDRPVRHKSKMHHTEGFATREEAEESAKKDLAPKIDGAKLKLETVFDWDGEGVPTLVAIFV